MAEIIVESRAVSKDYAIDGRPITVLDRVSCTMHKGEFVAVTGNSGSGKSTLLSVLSGLDQPTGGSVIVAGRDITDLGEDDLAPFRNLFIGFVFQAFHLIPSLNAIENVMFPAELKGDRSARDKAEQLLRRVGLFERRSHMVDQLSGGEKQRVAICRALINDPPLLFADEPTGNLDSKNSADILALLTELQREKQATLILATHSSVIAGRAGRVLHLQDGRLTGDEGASSC